MPNITINYSSEIFNTHFEEVWKNENRYLLLWGGGSSGKSHDAPEKILLRMLKESHSEIKHKFLVTRKIKDKIKSSVFNQFLERIHSKNLGELFHITESPMKIVCKNGNQIIFEGLDDVDKLNSIQGITGEYHEEAIQMNRKDFIILDKSMRSNIPFYQQMILCYNPVDWNSWLKSDFHDKNFNDSHLIHYKYQDNKFLNDKSKTMLENLVNVDEAYYKMYCKGEWATIVGLIYPKYNIINQFPNSSYKVYGLDYGFEHPACLVESFLIDNNLYTKQLLYNSGFTHVDIEKEFQRLNINKKQEMFISPERADLISFLYRLGYNVKSAKTGKGSVFAGIMFLKQFNKNLYFTDIELIDEHKSYKWKTDKNDLPVTPEQPIKFKDDGVDAERYAVYSAYYNKVVNFNNIYNPIKRAKNKLSITSGY